jgi:6-phosphogluconate dehydrogenase
MKIAMIGLGKMGMGITRRLIAKGHQVVAFDLNPDAVKSAQEVGAAPAESLASAVGQLDGTARIVWLMLPAGDVTGTALQELAPLLDQGDIVIDGGNSNYKLSMERAGMLRYRGIDMLDVGVSGGIWGESVGFNLMVGGSEAAFDAVKPILEALAPQDGYGYVGPSGAGHYVKMVHNGIEYGMMESLAEGFELMAAREEFGIDLAALSRLWTNGSVIRSWLLELAGNALTEDANLDWVEPYVEDTGEGRWTVQEGIDLSVPLPAITLSLQMRFRSRQTDSYAARLLAALRNQFGGHSVHRKQAS